MLKDKKIDWNLLISVITLLSVITGGVLTYFLISKKESEASIGLTIVQTELARIEQSNKEALLNIELRNQRLMNMSNFVDLVSKLMPSITSDKEYGMNGHVVHREDDEFWISVSLKNVGHYPTVISDPEIVISTSNNSSENLKEGVDYELIRSPKDYTLAKGQELQRQWAVKIDPKITSISYRLKWTSSIDKTIASAAGKVLEAYYSRDEISEIITSSTITRGSFSIKLNKITNETF